MQGGGPEKGATMSKRQILSYVSVAIAIVGLGLAAFWGLNGAGVTALAASFGLAFGFSSYWGAGGNSERTLGQSLRTAFRYLTSSERRYSGTIPEITINDSGQIIALTTASSKMLNIRNIDLPLPFETPKK